MKYFHTLPIFIYTVSLPSNESIDGTPLDRRSWALYKEGLEPSGWVGFPAFFFLKLEVMIP